MITTLGITLLIVGVGLVVWGIDTPDCTTTPVPPNFAGLPVGKPVWLLVGGIATAVTGLVLLP